MKQFLTDIVTARKLYKYGVFSGLYLDIFHAVFFTVTGKQGTTNHHLLP